MDHAVDAMSNGRRIGREESRVEAADAAGRGDRTGDEIKTRRVREEAGIGKGLPWTGQRRRGAMFASKAQAGFLASLADGGNGKRARAKA